MKAVTTSDIIDSLGGTVAVSKLCDISAPAVSHWKTRNKIPKAQMNYLRAIRPDVFSGNDQAKPAAIQ